MKRAKLPDISFAHNDPAKPLWLVVQEIKRGWVRLSGLMHGVRLVQHYRTDGQDLTCTLQGLKDVESGFSWAIQRYDTFFLPLSEALPRMKPRFERLNAWDKIDMDILSA